MNSKKGEKCLNCGNSLSDTDKFCAQCGQSTEKESSLKSFVSHFLSDYFTFDSKIFKSVRSLFVKPGYLTLEYLEGKRVSYIPPLRLFIFSSIIFFLFMGFLVVGETEVESLKNPDDIYWENFFESLLPKLFFFLSPFFAVLLALFFRKNGTPLKHFIFSIHYHATVFCLGSVYLLLSWVLALGSLQFVNLIFACLTVAFLIVYLFIALKRVYSQSIIQLIWKLPLLGLLYGLVVSISILLLALFSQ